MGTCFAFAQLLCSLLWEFLISFSVTQSGSSNPKMTQVCGIFFTSPLESSLLTNVRQGLLFMNLHFLNPEFYFCRKERSGEMRKPLKEKWKLNGRQDLSCFNPDVAFGWENLELEKVLYGRLRDYKRKCQVHSKRVYCCTCLGADTFYRMKETPTNQQKLTQTNTPSLQNPFFLFLMSQTMSSSFTGKFFFSALGNIDSIHEEAGHITSRFPSKSSASLLLSHNLEVIYESKVEILSSLGGYLSRTHGRLVRPPTPSFQGNCIAIKIKFSVLGPAVVLCLAITKSSRWSRNVLQQLDFNNQVQTGAWLD